jgi:hypothetical protein
MMLVANGGSAIMNVLLRDTSQGSEFSRTLDQIEPESWTYVLAPYDLPGRECCFLQDFWLGHSRNGKTWVLAVMPYGVEDDFNPQECAVAALLDPPKQHVDTIAEILIRVYIAGQSGDLLDTSAIENILAAVHFPVYQGVGHYLPEAPRDWLHLPAELVVGFTLSEGACVSRYTFEEYRRDAIEEVLRVVCGPRQDGILITYSLVAREVVPLLAWDVDWPLSRRGKEPPERREKVQGMLPWEYEADRSLLTIYQHVPGTGFWCAPPYCSKPVARLRVGGRTREAAITNWTTCARALRRLRNQVIEPANDSPAGDDLTVDSESEMALRTGRTL